MKNDLLAAVVVAAVSGLSLLAYRIVNGHQEAERFYYHRHIALFFVMHACNVVVVAAFALNAKYILAQVGSMVLAYLRS